MPAFPRIAIATVSLAWLTSFFIPIGFTALMLRCEWLWLILSVVCVSICSVLPFPTCGTIRTFLLNGIAEAVGGVQIVSKKEIIEKDRILYAIHPHGLTSTFAGFVLSDIEKRTGRRVGLVVAPLLRWMNPLMRILMGIMGIELLSSNKSCVQSEMNNGVPIGIVVGGFEEMLRTSKDRDVVFLRNRKGFLKQAARNGYCIVPIYCFGETQIYSNRLELGQRVRDWCAKWKIPAALPFGAGGISFMPRKLNGGCMIVMGEPMKWTRDQIESADGLEKVHAQYMTVVKQLYHEYNPFKGRELIIV